MQPEQWDQLKSEIHNKCVAYEYIDVNDASLSEFIISLIKLEMPPEKITEELNLMVGSDYDHNVTEWICARQKEMEASSQEAPHQEPEPMEEDQPQQTQEQPKEQTQNKSQEKEQASPIVASRIEKPKSRIFSQALGSALNNGSRSERLNRNRNKSRSRSRSPIRQGRRYDRSDRASRHEDSTEPADVFSRIGNVKTEERPSVFDRLGGSKASQIKSTHEESKEPKKEPKKERCKYWPSCQKGKQCPYFHPTRICPDFPNCPKKASECTFIHPETEQPKPQPQPAVAQVPIPCRFFPYCSNPVCPYMHPIMPPQSYYMQGKPTYGSASYKVQVPCKNGDACTRPDCHFIHPKDPNPQSEIICKFDGACTRPNCFYKHTKENHGPNKVLNNIENRNARQFSVPEEEIEEHITVGNSADLITEQPEQQTN